MTFLIQQTLIYAVPLMIVALAGVFAERSGIIKSTPITPPISAINAISKKEGGSLPVSDAHIKSAGNVKIAPAATDSPAEPIVCTILFSKTESFLKIMRITPIEMTAAGIDADTVIPTRSPRYAFAPPNKTASMMPKITLVAVNSDTLFSAGINGLKLFCS